MKKLILKVSVIVAALSHLNATTSAAECVFGYVWRDAKDGDDACVTPAERRQAKLQNAGAADNVRPGGGAYGPYTCRQGYVWREAVPGDVVCVTPQERSVARRQNSDSHKHEQ